MATISWDEGDFVGTREVLSQKYTEDHNPVHKG